MADVIEHTYNPKDILEKLKQLLNPNGKFIMSIPNISHGSIKLSLLANVFRYSEMGLLDKTHIRFFTRENIINLLTESNLQIEEENFVIHAPENIYFEPKNLMNYPPSIIKFVESDPYSYVYQFILSVKPSLNVDNKKKLNLRDIPVENAKGIKWKDIIKFMIRKPLFLFRKDFWELVKRK